jgi:hypothetical protein
MALALSSPDLFGRQAVYGCSSGSISVVQGEKSIADSLVKSIHYSGSVVWSSNLHLLVTNNTALIGALQFGPAMNPNSGQSVVAGSSPDGWLELNRMVLVPERPEQCGTVVLSLAFKLLRHLRPKVEWVQSFADERCGKFGGIYQAASFLYCGEHHATFYRLDGEWFHKSMWNRPLVDKRGWGCGPKITRFNLHRERATPVDVRQFRYIKCLTKRARRNLLLPVLPYPKPDAEVGEV